MHRSYTPHLVTAAVIALSALYLLWIGRVPWCECGYVKLWHGETMSSENSQHISDWYTPSHIIHGLLFYAGLWLVARRLSFGWRLTIATVIECAWEIIENSDAIIERYRAVTISLDYYGDSVLNTVADVLAMILGFWLARVLPVWVSVALVIFFEVLTAWVIRDGLVLNVLMLLWPLEGVMEWQSGG
ncbi:DUF2585 domain-containing protein [Silicimonas algicola]|uniref:UPF0314 protein C8D95_110117 n=1 Tax=Silicimonas algicola TaxID=1826607 RepID=A0A316G390_9RHOB|nr:DUF2585 domain-containing protein [Silicimonas algicola]AZQ65798.1 DUF2585 domain-containing protein [Silicimonas algicola]PWK54825.1 uncharacterized protein DUF2585 [Silicimonas algicola]